MTTMLDAEYLTVDEAAALVRVNQSTIRRWIRTGALPAYRVGQRHVRIRRDDLGSVLAPVDSGATPIPSSNDGSTIVIRPMTEEERCRVAETVAIARARIAEQRSRGGGDPRVPPSWVMIREGREERTRQLLQ